MMGAGNFDGAIVVLNEIIPIFEAKVAAYAQCRTALEYAHYGRGVCYHAKGDCEKALEALQVFVQKFPNSAQKNRALILMADCHVSKEQWAEATAITGPLREQPELAPIERMAVNRLHAEAMMALKKWAEAVSPLLYVFRNTRESEVKTASAVSLAICLVRLERYKELYQFLPQVYRTPMRFDVDLNLAMIEEGDKKYGALDYEKALLLYRLVQKKSVIREEVEKRIAGAEVKLRRATTGERSWSPESLPEKGRYERELRQLKKQKEAIEKAPDYDQELELRSAGCYFELQRYLEAINVYRGVYEDGPATELGQQALFSCFSTAYAAGDQERSLREGYEYLRAFPAGTYWDSLVLNLMQVHIQRQEYERALAVAEKGLQVKPDFAGKDQLTYLKGYCHFQMENFEKALADFMEMVALGREGAFADAGEYWFGMCHLFLQHYGEARQAFSAFLEKFADRPFSEDAAYRLGVACYGEGDFDAAERAFEDFLYRYPDTQMKSETLSMLGDIAGVRGDLDRAIELYQRAPESAVNQVQINYAYFQAARTMELEQRFDQIIEHFRTYMSRYGERGNFTEAAYWIGNAYMRQGKSAQALAEFFTTIVKYGNAPEHYGVDMILRDLASQKSEMIAPEERRKFMEQLYGELDRARKQKESTLELRLITLFAETATKKETRDELVASILKEGNINVSGPVTLALMGREAQAKGLLPFARKVYAFFLKHYSDSDLVVDALRGMAEVHLRENRPDEATKLLEEIANRFAMLPDAAWANLRLAEIKVQQGRYDEAVKVYNMVLAVKEWKGEAWAEALCGVGMAHMAEGKTQEAFAFFQRVYVMYGGYPQWAAKAYVQSAICLDKLGKADEAIQTLIEMLGDERFAKTEAAHEGRKMLIRLRGG